MKLLKKFRTFDFLKETAESFFKCLRFRKKKIFSNTWMIFDNFLKEFVKDFLEEKEVVRFIKQLLVFFALSFQFDFKSMRRSRGVYLRFLHKFPMEFFQEFLLWFLNRFHLGLLQELLPRFLQEVPSGFFQSFFSWDFLRNTFWGYFKNFWTS